MTCPSCRMDLGSSASKQCESTFRLEGEFWTITYAATTFRLKRSRGLTFLAALLSEPGRAMAAAELAARAQLSGFTPSESDPDCTTRRGLGDAGQLLDPEARASYKQRVAELREELDQAESFHDNGRTEQLRVEIEFLTHELSRAVGLGGRQRRAGSHAERARVNVTRAISLVLTKIDVSHPVLGEHLRRTVRTGTLCCYAPDPRAPIEWETGC